jgi:hypothetical protein
MFFGVLLKGKGEHRLGQLGFTVCTINRAVLASGESA